MSGSDPQDSPARRIFPFADSFAEEFFADANIVRRHPAEAAAWLWTDVQPPQEAAVARFSLPFSWEASGPLTFHVTADQRFHLSLDGKEVAVGPDRCDLAHWTVASYEATLTPGSHCLEALVWWLPDAPLSPDDPTHRTGWRPMGQPSWRPGFLLAGEGTAHDDVSTGCAPWQVQDLTAAVSTRKVPFPSYHDIGPAFRFDLAAWSAPRSPQPAAVILPPLTENFTGVVRPGWKLAPAELPEQERTIWTGGSLRSLQSGDGTDPWSENPDANWQALVEGKAGVEIAPQSTLAILWDLEDYLCGWPLATLSGGAGAVLTWEWAEALYESETSAISEIRAETPKGRRDEIAGKIFFGFGDSWISDGGSARPLPSLAWRAGRFVRLVIRTQSAPLRLDSLAIRTTRYPFRRESAIHFDDPGLQSALPLMVRTLEVSAHDCWSDSPYYEQMSYVGDNVLEALTQYTYSRDDRLTRRAIKMFDWSRHENGLVSERHPGSWTQVSTTYAMLWPLMLRHHGWWRDDPAFLRARLPGLRCLMENLLPFRQPDGLLGRLPGWSFVDWVPVWEEGVPPGAHTGTSSLINLQFLLCLQAAADLESAFGEEARAARWRERGDEIAAAIRDRFSLSAGGLIPDDPTGKSHSEHAQALALLTGLLPADQELTLLEALKEKDPTLTPATVYFSFYVLEALARFREGGALLQRLDLWRGFAGLGLLTVPEMPEPSRSDCHGWSTHPHFHFFASLAGIRPAAPGFRRLRMAPAPGPLPRLSGHLPHPAGRITFDLDFTQSTTRGTVELPPEVEGEFFHPGTDHPHLLTAGRNVLG